MVSDVDMPRRPPESSSYHSAMIFHTVQGERVPALGFGTYLLKGDDCVEGVKHALELGYRHIDTAQSYENEAEVGAGIVAAGVPRDDVFLVSKLRPSNYLRAEEATRESLRALGTDHVDLMLLHWPKDTDSTNAALEALGRLQSEGAVRHVGVSNFPTAHVTAAAEVVPLFCNQVEYHPFLAQSRVLEQAIELDLLITAYRPLAKGLTAEEPLLRELAVKHRKTPQQVTLRWLVQQPRVATIPKSADPGRRARNLDIFDFELTADEAAAIGGLARGKRLVNPESAPEWDA